MSSPTVNKITILPPEQILEGVYNMRRIRGSVNETFTLLILIIPLQQNKKKTDIAQEISMFKNLNQPLVQLRGTFLQNNFLHITQQVAHFVYSFL